MKWAKVYILLIAIAVIVGFFFLVRHLTDHTDDFRDAVYSGNLEDVEELLKAHPSLINTDTLDDGSPRTAGFTALHVAAVRNNVKMIDLLVQHHAKLDARDKHGLTPLLWTAFSGQREAAAALLSDGADINARGLDGRTTLDLAKLSLDTKLIELLRERGAKE